MKRVTKDFITLFNSFWYRDFPLAQNHKDTGSRAEWTTHIGICVRASADLLGFFTHFEQGNRTDAVIRNNLGEDIAHIEWEWKEPIKPGVNEIEKLKAAREDCQFSVFISYSRLDNHKKNISLIKKQWGKRNYPLVIILVTFEFKSGARRFHDLETYHYQGGRWIKPRYQPALPWKIKGSRWEESI